MLPTFFINLVQIILVTSSQELICRKTLPHEYSFCFDSKIPCLHNWELIDNSVCNKTISVARVDIYPQNETLKSFIKGLTENCCGSCQNLKFTKEFAGPREMSEALNDGNADYDFIYPVLGYYFESVLFGRYFIPFLPARSALLIIKQKTKVEIMKDLLTACLNLWPLLTICVFMAFIAGFLGWIMDTWKNVEEFPRPFLSGVYEGFWWSFVSMTTVGYGDKTPRSNCARLFSICWILIGITICSMFTASLTAAITEASSSPDKDINSKKIGILNNRILDAALAIKKSGIVVKESSNINVLFDALESDEIEGILLDADSAKFLLSNISLKNYLKIEKDFSSEGLAYGALVRYPEQYSYFNAFMKDNHLLFETCLNKDKGKHEEDMSDINIFALSGGLFWPSFIATMSIIFSIGIFGLVYEHFRRKKTKTQIETGKTTLENEAILIQLKTLLNQLQIESSEKLSTK